MKPFKTLLLIAYIASRASEPNIDSKLADFRQFAEAQLKLWHAPGASIAIVRGNDVIAVTGYGLRDLKDQKPMTGKTVQPIASITKSFTVASLAVLVRDGKLNWDKPVRDFMPEFRLYDEYATAHITPRDLVTHATGLPRHDWVWVGTTASREDLVRRLRYLEPSAEPRARYQYNNLAFCTAGYLAGRVGGSSWEDMIRTGIFEPLHMENSSASVTVLAQNEDHATPYRLNEKEEPIAIRYLNVDSLGPAGSINSNAEDMSRYLRMLINKGKFEDQTILSETDVIEMMAPRIVVPDADIYSELGSSQYAMGLRVTTYRGYRMIQHGGALRGLSASLAILPEQKLGVFVAANVSDSSIPSVFTYAVFDRLLGLEPVDWSARFRERREKDKASREEAAAQKISTRKPNTTPAHPLEEYAGVYEHGGYGIFQVSANENRLLCRFNGASSPFDHFHYEVFAAPKNESNSFSEQKIQFQTSLDGEVESVAVQFEPATSPIIFKRRPDAKLFEPEFLARFVGEYEVGAARAKVTMRADNRLTWFVPGAPVRELEPVRGARFAMKDRPGYSVEFLADDDGSYNRIALHTPNGSSLGKRPSRAAPPRN
jgi:CubicO group peptidase (beta-lactamase class C family)